MIKAKRKFVVGAECRRTLETAAAKHTPATLSTQLDDRWEIYKSRILAVRANRLVLERPVRQDGSGCAELDNGQQLAITFKKGYHKCLFVARMMATESFEPRPGEAAEAIVVPVPEHIEKIQRRAYNRADAPVDEPVPVSLTGSNSQADADKKLHGVLRNISAGGMAVTVAKSDATQLVEGEQLELHCVPVAQQQPLRVTVRVRHVTEASDDSRCVVGLQMLGLEMDEDGRRTLRRIARIVSLYQKQSQMSPAGTDRRNAW